MDIRVLRYFLAVAREGNITKAAESLHIAQPSLSKQMMDLEDEIGKPLFIRGKRHITLTDEGMLLRKRAEEIDALMRKTENELKEGNHIAGQIHIGGGSTQDIYKLAALFRKKYPDVQFCFYCDEAYNVMEKLDHGSLDFAVLLEPIDTMKYDYISLPQVSSWGLLMNKDDPYASLDVIRSQDIQHIPLIVHQREELQRELALWANVEIESLNIAATFNITHGANVNYIKDGLGSLLTVDTLIEKNENTCFKYLSPPLTTKHALVWKRHALLNETSQCFLETVKNPTQE